MPLLLETLAEGRCVRFQPRGTSMLPLLRQGADAVELSPPPKKLKKYDIPFYARKNGQYVLHRIVKAGEHYTCVGDNQFDLEYPVSHSQVIAVVTAVYRNGRRIEVTSSAYRAYCVFWHYTRPLRHLYRRTRAAVGSIVKHRK